MKLRSTPLSPLMTIIMTVITFAVVPTTETMTFALTLSGLIGSFAFLKILWNRKDKENNLIVLSWKTISDGMFWFVVAMFLVTTGTMSGMNFIRLTIIFFLSFGILALGSLVFSETKDPKTLRNTKTATILCAEGNFIAYACTVFYILKLMFS